MQFVRVGEEPFRQDTPVSEFPVIVQFVRLGEEPLRSTVVRLLEHYEAQTDEEAVAEDEAAYDETTLTTMRVPVELVPAVRQLIAEKGSEVGS